MTGNSKNKNYKGNFNQNDGVSGVVYILRNEAFKENWLKIGCSRHSGHVRARDMNKKASTGLPAHHICVFEFKTLDCGNAEKAVFQALKSSRKGRQEFFEIDINFAKLVIQRECEIIDRAILKSQEDQLRTAADRARSDAYLREMAEQRQLRAEREREREQEQERERRLAEDRQKLNKIRKEREEQERASAERTVDIACPQCHITLSLPADRACQKNQKFRCKNCYSIFLNNEASQVGKAEVKKQENGETPKFVQTPIKKQKTRIIGADILAYFAIAGFIFLYYIAYKPAGTEPIKNNGSAIENTKNENSSPKISSENINTTEELNKNIESHYKTIIKAHSDALDIASSKNFQTWVSANPMRQSTLHSGTAEQVISVISNYKAEQRSTFVSQTATTPEPQKKMLRPLPPTQQQSREQGLRSTTTQQQKPLQQRADVQAAISSAYAEFPYLQTEDGEEAMRHIFSKANLLVVEHDYHPVEAFEDAARGIAPRLEPIWYKSGALQTVSPPAAVQTEEPKTKNLAHQRRPCRIASPDRMPLRLECK